MKVKILFFGATADAAGTRAAEVDLPDNATASDVIGRATGDFPLLSNHKLLFALNEEYVKGDEKLTEGDQVAIFTAVSGG